ncbi:hypothetical protein GOBAR_AA37961 [Gossypium barbadense]|uniref:Uncharacterized protein n=1 Tax=Gossypium barbadense TaxID=3634 RepID=A0A2P5VV81_GOSBA|nr:hypothetical protein GOBAR_AA37961 [Gossypium barbadense]
MTGIYESLLAKIENSSNSGLPNIEICLYKHSISRISIVGICLPKNCPQLKVFSPTEERDVIGDHILLNVPCPENLSVSNCPQFSCFIVQAQLMEVLELSNVGNSRQLLNVDLPLLNEDCMIVGNHGEIIWKDFVQVVTLKNLRILKLSEDYIYPYTNEHECKMENEDSKYHKFNISTKCRFVDNCASNWYESNFNGVIKQNDRSSLTSN